MTLHSVTLAFLLAMLLLGWEPSSCENVKGSVSCLDCDHHYNLAGVMVAVKCDKIHKLTMAATESDGSFSAEIPSDSSSTTPGAASINCLAKLLGGSDQLYATRKNLVSKVIQAHNDRFNSYTIAAPLAFSTTCPLAKEDGKCIGLGSSKTIDIPLPPEWGFAPSSYYIGVIPIIGVP